MGQRHQVYLAFPENASYIEPDKKVNVAKIGLHHQWLYGRTAVACLGQTLALAASSDNFTSYADSKKMSTLLWSLFNVNVAYGYFSGRRSTSEHDTIEDIRSRWHNNDGYTLIQVCAADGGRLEKPRYCYLFPDESDFGTELVTPFVAMSAEQYLELYYPNKQFPDSKINAEDQATLKEDIENLLAAVADYDVMTTEQAREMFPELFVPTSAEEDAA